MTRYDSLAPEAGPWAPSPVWVVTLRIRWDDRNPACSSPLQITSSPRSCRSGNSARDAIVVPITASLPTTTPDGARTAASGA